MLWTLEDMQIQSDVINDTSYFCCF